MCPGGELHEGAARGCCVAASAREAASRPRSAIRESSSPPPANLHLVSTHVADELRQLLRDRHDLALVVLFGSCAQGKEREGSDIDVAVLPAGELSSVDEAQLEGAIARLTGRDVDLVRLDRTDDVILRREIARGVPLRQGARGAFARFTADAVLEWLEFEPTYRAAQQLYLRRVAKLGRAADR